MRYVRGHQTISMVLAVIAVAACAVLPSCLMTKSKGGGGNGGGSFSNGGNGPIVVSPIIGVAASAGVTCVVVNHDGGGGAESRVECIGLAGNDYKLGSGEGGGSWYVQPLRYAKTSPGAVDYVKDAADVAVGNDHMCILLTSGRVRCYGNNMAFQTGYTTDTGTQTYGYEVQYNPGTTGPLDNVTAITSSGRRNLTGSEFNCALRSGNVWCWGNDSSYQLGTGVFHASGVGLQTMAVMASDDWVTSATMNNVTQVVAGGMHACALRSDGTVYCWGWNVNYETGNGQCPSFQGNDNPVARPVATAQLSVGNCNQPVNKLSGVKIIAAGENHTCALKSDNTVWCWGQGTYGQLGNSAVNTFNYAVQVNGLPPGEAVLDIAAGRQHTCVVVGTDRRIHCWGANDYRQLGRASTGQSCGGGVPCSQQAGSASPQIRNVSYIISGPSASHNLAMKTDGVLYGWGSNDGGMGIATMELGYDSGFPSGGWPSNSMYLPAPFEPMFW